MKKIKVTDEYIDSVIRYFNLLLDGGDPGSFGCGMCVAAHIVTPSGDGLCGNCPLDMSYTNNVICANRHIHLINKACGDSTNQFMDATPESIEVRVRWMMDQVNKYTSSKWKLYLK